MHIPKLSSFLSTLLFSLYVPFSLATVTNFPFEAVQLAPNETARDPSIRFGYQLPPPSVKPCKYKPADPEWPSDDKWDKFNQTLGGRLLKPSPPAAVCYQDRKEYNVVKCALLKRLWQIGSTHAEDPISISTPWSTGNTCLLPSGSNSTCTQGGYPVYVVDARTVRDIQLAVNFARNQNLRLVIKNSGHDFNGRSAGAYALSIWVHNIKNLTFHDSYNIVSPPPKSPWPNPTKAISYSAGVQSTDLQMFASRFNITVIAPGGSSVGAIGGFAMSGGHSSYTSLYGLAADHILEIKMVLADGRFVTANAEENEDLYWAVRGGGGGTFGVVTSITVRTFPVTPIASTSIVFSTVPTASSNLTVSRTAFWRGIRIYFAYVPKFLDAGGQGYNFIRHIQDPRNSSNWGITFTTSVSIPFVTTSEFSDAVEPMLKKMRDEGLPVGTLLGNQTTTQGFGKRRVRRWTHQVPSPAEIFDIQMREDHNNYHHHSYTLNSRSLPSTPYDDSTTLIDPTDPPPPQTGQPYPGGNTVGTTRLASRLFPRTSFLSPSALNLTTLAMRQLVEAGGYTFHGINYSPTLARAGYPSNAILPAYRNTMMHAEIFDSQSFVVAPPQLITDYKRFHRYIDDYWAPAIGSDRGGSYVNEGDSAGEKNWRDMFYAGNWGRLSRVKSEVDPWGLFYVVSGVGSERWEVRGGTGGEGLKRQDGVLCRV